MDLAKTPDLSHHLVVEGDVLVDEQKGKGVSSRLTALSEGLCESRTDVTP